MKKFNILLMGVLAMAFVACDETTPSVPPIQSNPQGPILTDADVNGHKSGILSAEGDTVKLQEYYEAGIPLEVFTQTSDSLPEGWTPTYKIELGNDSDFTKTKVVNVSMDGNIGYVSVDDLNEAHMALFGRKQDVRTVYYRIEAFASNGGTDYRIGGMDTYFGTGDYLEICRQMGTVIEDNYYLYSDLCEGKVEEAAKYPFWHSKADVYEDPIFTITIEATKDLYWKVLPPAAIAANNEDGVLGVKVDGDPAASGDLVDSDPQPALIETSGWYNININLEEMTYWVTSFPARPYLCTPGGSNGWDQTKSQWIELKNDAYHGAVVVKDEFKFSIDNWDENWGAKNDSTLVAGGENNNIKVASGLYWATADVKNLTYSLVPVTSVGVIGVLCDWNADAPVELTANADQTVWEGDVDITGEWKIIINHSWGSSYGAGRLTCPTYDGGNFSGYEGSYHVSVDFSGNYPMITLTEK